MNAEKKIDKKYVETPLMKQYYSIKAVHPDAILLFRVGDFYETFGEDAIKASGILGITLTRRANGSATYVELAGFPYHAIDTYLPKLVRAGERVAICEQLEDPKLVRGLVKRGVIELVTPGIVLGDNILANKENAFLASVYFGRQTTGVAFLDISTGEFYVAEGYLTENTNLATCCRTQVRVRLNSPADYFLRNPLGNHHVLIQGHHAELLKAFMLQNRCKQRE